MAALKPTPARLDLLRAAEYGDVWQEPDGTSVLTDRDVLGLSEIVGVVTDEMAALEAAGLAVLVRGRHANHWEPTDTGRAVLAAADTLKEQ